jgi:small nuclear ribonucleoprotein (snRNP)-like protein
MDYESIAHYLNQQVLLTLKSGFWYRANIISVSETAVVFIELRGRTITVSPEQIVLIEEVKENEK